MPAFDTAAYLERIGYAGPVSPSAETLRSLHRQHMLTVPFENLDIHRSARLDLDESKFFRKVVGARRGGWCYELNGLFARLLVELGFEVDRVAARVAMSEGQLSPDFSHLALIVRLEERWLADVGFGDSFLEPLRLDFPAAQRDPVGEYLVRDEGGHWTVLRRTDDIWKEQYQFTLTPRQLRDFSEMCQFQQTSPESHFTRNVICSRATPGGRVTLGDKRLIFTTNGQRREVLLFDDADTSAALAKHFGIVLK